MSYIASNIKTVPGSGFKWYLIFLESPFADEISKQIDQHFAVLGREVGADALAVRGYDASEFRGSVFEATCFYSEKWSKWAVAPALIVTDIPPIEALADSRNLEQRKVLIFPLAEPYAEDKSLVPFFTKLLSALRDPNALTALQNLQPTKLETAWGWLRKYSKMEPGFFGFHLKADKAVADLLKA
jgi:hypothetical protein